MKKDLTLARVRNTDFPQLYKRFILDEELSLKNKEKVLAIATIFLNSKNTYVQNLGYRIVLIFCNRTKDYRPLYEVAINLGYIPVAKSIDWEGGESFFREFNSAFFENFCREQIYMSEQQLQLDKFFDENNYETLSVVAPTSVG